MKSHASTSSILVFLVVALSVGCAHAETPSWIGAREINGREAQGIAVAVREFEKHQGTKTARGEPVYGDLKHYVVEFARRGSTLQVGFTPESGPIDRREGAVGGRGQYGIEVHYHVSLRTLKVVRTTWAR